MPLAALTDPQREETRPNVNAELRHLFEAAFAVLCIALRMEQVKATCCEQNNTPLVRAQDAARRKQMKLNVLRRYLTS